MSDDRTVLLVEGHVSAAELGAAILLWNAGMRLANIDGWAGYAPVAYGLSALCALLAVVPWLWPTVELGILRAAKLLAIGGSTALGFAALVVLDLSVLAASQLLLIALALAELPVRPHVLRWLWAVSATTAAVIVVYYVATPLRLVPD